MKIIKTNSSNKMLGRTYVKVYFQISRTKKTMKKLNLVSRQIYLLSITSFYFLLKLPTNQTFYSYKHKKYYLNCFQCLGVDSELRYFFVLRCDPFVPVVLTYYQESKQQCKPH